MVLCPLLPSRRSGAETPGEAPEGAKPAGHVSRPGRTPLQTLPHVAPRPHTSGSHAWHGARSSLRDGTRDAADGQPSRLPRAPGSTMHRDMPRPPAPQPWQLPPMHPPPPFRTPPPSLRTCRPPPRQRAVTRSPGSHLRSFRHAVVAQRRATGGTRHAHAKATHCATRTSRRGCAAPAYV